MKHLPKESDPITRTQPSLSLTFSYLETEENFKNFLMISLLLHLSFLLMIPLKNLILPERTLNLAKSIRVDVVALPEKALEDALTVTPETSTSLPTNKNIIKEIIDKKNEVKDLTKTKEAQSKALDRLKALQALEKITQEMNENKLQKTNPVKTPPYKGQIISSGRSFTGLSRLRINEYLENLTEQIHNQWELPQWLSNVSLKAVVVVSVDSRGYAIKNEIYVSSGNTVFDESCLAAVNASLPFASPPDEVREALLLVRFPFE